MSSNPMLSTLEDVGLVTVTFNSSAVARYFAGSACHFSHVFVVDNASTDNSPEKYSAEIPKARVLRQVDNLGFGAANNVGLAEASGLRLPYVLFLNPDCHIDRDSVLLLKQTLEQHPDAAIVSPAVLGRDKEVRPLMRWDFRQPYAGMSPVITSVSELQGQVIDQVCIDGACFMVRTDLFTKAGAFTDDLFLFCEEDDVGMRIARAGYASLFNPNATCQHIGGGSTPPSLRIELRKAYSVRWSRLFMTDRYISSAARKREALRILLAAPIALLLYAITFNRKRTVRWLGWGLAGLDGVFLTKYFRRWI